MLNLSSCLQVEQKTVLWATTSTVPTTAPARSIADAGSIHLLIMIGVDFKNKKTIGKLQLLAITSAALLQRGYSRRGPEAEQPQPFQGCI